MNKGIGLAFLNFSVAIYLFATGILGFTRKGVEAKLFSEIHNAVQSIFKEGDFSKILIVVLALLAIAAGVFILLKFFGISVDLIEKILIVLAITWGVFILMIDIVPLFNNKGTDFVVWLKVFGSHFMALSGILLSTERFGG